MENQDEGFLKAEELIQILDQKKPNQNNKVQEIIYSQRIPGEIVWIKNDKCDENLQDNSQKPFYKCEVLNDYPDKLDLQLAKGETCQEPFFQRKGFEWSKNLVFNNSLIAEKGIEDMIKIDELNHATVLDNMKQRYQRQQIYTYVGPTLLVMNPFARLLKDNTVDDFKVITNAGLDYYDVKNSLPPHTFAVSAYAHKQMIDLKIRQGIVISGESGAGKTEAAKLAMFFLTSLGSAKSSSQIEKAPVGERILKTNPVLEAFGNSMTARNPNSSRFGKYTKMFFDQNLGLVEGAEIKNYLLEKSRVIGCTDKERNYHAFFFVLRGASDEMAKAIHLNNPDGSRKTRKDFKYLSVGKDKDEAEDVKDYEELMSAFEKLGFTKEEILSIHKIISAVLYIGQIELDKTTYDDGRAQKPVSIKNKDVIDLVSELLGIKTPENLITELVYKPLMPGVKDRVMEKPQNCQNAVDSLAKSLFDNMFNWLVNKMNIEILPDVMKSRDASSIEAFSQRTKTIGLLDIFGFENFELNQFEQLCINFVNEKLHNLYISAVFGAEQEEMKRQDLEIKLVLPPMKVLNVLNLMSNTDIKKGSLGIFQLVADKTGGGMGSDDINKKVIDCYNSITKSHDANTNVFTKIKNTTKFTIQHSAKDVTYDSRNFIERNADSISASLAQLLLNETEQTISTIYSMKTGFEIETAEQQNKNKNQPKTIWGKFSNQIEELMNELAEPLLPQDFLGEQAKKPVVSSSKSKDPVCEPCDLHFIRCIKPKPNKEFQEFASAMTLQQITYMGVLESIKVKQENLPYRYYYEEFYKANEIMSQAYVNGRYDLMKEHEKKQKNWKELVTGIMNRIFSKLKPDDYQGRFALGKTKILYDSQVKLIIDRCRQLASFKYDKNAQIVKRTFSLMQARDQITLRYLQMMRIQKQMRNKYKLLQFQRANYFKKKVEAALVQLKTLKRKDLEQDASNVLENVYRVSKFRDHLNTAIQSRKFMMQAIFSLVTINRLRKMWICRRQVMKIVDKAFNLAKQRAENASAYRIQRIVRGHIERAGKKELIMKAIRMKVELKQHVSAKKIQKKIKGLQVRRRLHYLAQCASKIQANFKAFWTRRVFLMIKRNVLILQKAYRRYITRKDQIKIRLFSHLTHEFQVLENVKAMEYGQLHGVQVSRFNAQKLNLLRTITPYTQKKITFFTRILDLQILVDLSEIYQLPWTTQWVDARINATLTDSPIMHLTHGQTHTMICNSKGKIYSWGWNDNGQCGQPSNILEVVLQKQTIKQSQVQIQKQNEIDADKESTNIIRQAIAVEDRNLLLIQDIGEILVWGGNSKGQLGLGHYEDVFLPQKLDIFSKNGENKAVYIAAGGDLNLICTEQGEAYAFPFNVNGLKVSLPVRMPFSGKTQIVKVSCGYNFGFFISNQGLVYAMGEDNREGQLGLGHLYPTEFPELILTLKNIGERIDTIECGYKHAIAKSTLGKVYTWGSSSKGQLGHGHFDVEMSPRLVSFFDYSKKIDKIAAGFSNTVVMSEQKNEIFWFGTCGNLVLQSTPIILDLSKFYPDLFGIGSENQTNKSSIPANDNGIPHLPGSQQQDFAVVKVCGSWSKTMSITNTLIADLRAINQYQPYSKISSSLKTLCSKWDPRDIKPPYIESVSNLFSSNIMKKVSQKAGNEQKYQQKSDYIKKLQR